MITWATFALLITASPILAWRYMLRQEKKQPPALPAEPRDAVPPPQPVPATHVPQQKPSWAASATNSEQTMQIALGGPGGRKE